MVQKILTFDFRCFRCGCPQRVPIPPEYDSPIHVMEVERRQQKLLKHLDQMETDLMALAHECVEAGVRPEILRRADDLKALLEAWRQSLGE